VTEYSDRNQI